MLIEGSGLVAEYTATNAVVLQPEPAAPARGGRQIHRVVLSQLLRPDPGRRARCSAACRRWPWAVPGGGELWRVGAGTGADAHLLDSSGDADRDEAITQALNGIALGKAPPEGLAQPFVMLIVPQSADHDRACVIR